MVRAAFAAVGLLLLSYISPCAEQAPQTHAELEAKLQAILDETNGVGLAASLVSGDRMVWQVGLGFADVAGGREVDEDTVFRVGSISKSFVALAALILQERGKLSLQDKLTDIAPEVRFTNPHRGSSPVRLVHLLEHTSGFDNMRLREYAHTDPDITTAEAVAFNQHSRRVRWQPGRHWSYSNIGPTMAALMIEKVSGQAFEQFVHENILDVLGMEPASFLLADRVRANLAKGYKADGTTEMPYRHTIYRPSGAFSATAGAMSKLVILLMNRGVYQGRRILQPESIDRMEVPTTTLAAQRGMTIGWGLGSRVEIANGFLFYGHDGGKDGFSAYYGYLADHRVGYFLSVNSQNPATISRVRETIQSFVVRDLSPPSAVPIDVTDDLDQYAGYYVWSTPIVEMTRFLSNLWTIRVRAENGMLTMHFPVVGLQEWVSVGNGRFRNVQDPVPTVIFIQDESGDMILQGSTLRTRTATGALGTLIRASAFRAYLGWGLAGSALLLMASSLLFGLIWIPRKILGRMRDVPHLSVRFLPLSGILLCIAAAVLLVTGGLDLGRFGMVSVFYWAISWLFALTAALSLVQCYRARSWPISRAVWIHSLSVSSALVLLTGYLGYFGVIGMRLWVY